MKTFRTFLLPALLVLAALPSRAEGPQGQGASKSAAPTADAPAPTANALHNRVQSYLDGLLAGDRSPMLEAEDFYSRIYLVRQARIERIVAIGEGNYGVLLHIWTRSHIDQKPIGAMATRRETRQGEDFLIPLRFEIRSTYLSFSRKLMAPFVLPGHEGRFLLPDKSQTR